VARNYLIAGLMGLAALSAACSGGDEAVAEQAQEARVAAARARSDSIRRARAELAANPAAAGMQMAVSSAAATPGGTGVNEVQREVFAYSGGPRDPFASLMNLKAVGPELGNLQLVGIYLDLRSNDNSVAVLREKDSGKRYKLHTGDQLGRMQVVQIGAKDVVFRIEDFGYERQETLSLRKQEDMTP